MAMSDQQGDDRKALLEEIAARISHFELPPEGFDPLKAEPEILWIYGIPPKPNAEEFPTLAEFWVEMFSPPLVFRKLEYALMPDPVVISDQIRMSTTGRRESSLNWSGAYITPSNGRQLTEVHGRWTVPTVTAPPGAPGNQEFRSSIWVGFDGQRRYFDSSLPQIGTGQFVNAPNDPPYSAWFQWWLRDNPLTHFPVTIVGLTVSPGDRMMANLRVLSETQVHFLIKNQTNGLFARFALAAPRHHSTSIQAKVSGATAEWVVERPTDENGELYELPDYDVVDLKCFAISAHMPPRGTPAQEHTLDGARLINMYKVERDPSRTVVISRTQRRADDRIETTFIG
jgi:hypothetical protein